jgi:hypothetical protein
MCDTFAPCLRFNSPHPTIRVRIVANEKWVERGAEDGKEISAKTEDACTPSATIRSNIG